MATAKWQEALTRHRQVGTPIVALDTVDPLASVAAVAVLFEGSPVYRWDCVEGIRAVSPGAPNVPSEDPTFPAESGMRACLNAPTGAIIVATNMQAFWDKAEVAQAIQNLRDGFKVTERMLIVSGPGAATVPPMIANDVITLAVGKPTDEELREMVKALAEGAEVEAGDANVAATARKLRGLAAFKAEQAAAYALHRDGYDVDQAWEENKAFLSSIPGLSVKDSRIPLDEVAGLDRLKEWVTSIGTGPLARKPSLVVQLEEVEKFLGGSGAGGGPGDSTGVTADTIGVLCRAFDPTEYGWDAKRKPLGGWTGTILVGVPGTGKSHVARAFASAFDCPMISWDMGKMKSQWHGVSEQQIRQVIQAFFAIGGYDVFFVCTSNKLEALPMELKDRMKASPPWFVDLPQAPERETIWRLEGAAAGVDVSVRPNDEGWSGRDIRDCVMNAASSGKGLEWAAQWVIPAIVRDAATIERIRSECSKYLAASTPQNATGAAGTVAAVRKVKV